MPNIKDGSFPIKTEIPRDWTFKSANVAATFGSHVREQLPWYDLATKAVAHLGRHYIPEGGLAYDVGASTGNIYEALKDTIKSRNAKLVAIEQSQEMCCEYFRRHPEQKDNLYCKDALGFNYEPFDFMVCFLVLMFLPVERRYKWLMDMGKLMKPGGAIVVVDKVNTPPGYAGTAMRRLAMAWKLDNGASPEDIIKKELSLAGYQRPLDGRLMDRSFGERFFTLGEFAGWVIERQNESSHYYDPVVPYNLP